MKNQMKTLFLVLFIGLSYSYSFGQFGVRAGLNGSKLSTSVSSVIGSISIDTDTKLGLHLGGFYESQLSESLDIRPGLLYSMKGGKITDETTMEESSITLNYLEVPVDFVYNFGTNANHLAVEAGPYLGYLLSESQDPETEDDSGVASMDFGLNFGLSYTFGKHSVGLNYGLGIANIQEEIDDPSGLLGDTSVKNKNVGLYVATRF